jgi:hypothetical protein
VATSFKSNFYSQSQLQVYGWRALCIEFLCGVVAIVWYVLALAELTVFRGLTRLEKLAAHQPENGRGIATPAIEKD